MQVCDTMAQQVDGDGRNGPPAIVAAAPFPVDEFRRFYAAMACGVSVLDASGTILYASEAAERILDLTLDQLSGRTALDPRWDALHEDGSRCRWVERTWQRTRPGRDAILPRGLPVSRRPAAAG